MNPFRPCRKRLGRLPRGEARYLLASPSGGSPQCEHWGIGDVSIIGEADTITLHSSLFPSKTEFLLMHSIRIQFISFITALLLVLLLLLNSYPLISSRDAVFEEKRSSMTAQAATLASSLSGLERLSPENIAEVLRYLDLSGYTRVLVADRSGGSLYDSAGQAGGQIPADLLTCLKGKTVFRSSFREAAFLSSIAIPLSAQGELTGALYLTERDEERAEMLLGFQHRIRAASLGIGALALVVALVYVFLLVNRIRDIVRSMRVVAGGDYSYRHVNRGKDEISELGEEFNQLTERLETTEEQRRRFVSDASHELKTPLASIRLLADSIVQNENVDAETMREFVTDIGNEAKRLQRTTDKLLTLSRLDDNAERELVSVDMKQVVLDTLTPLRPLAQEKQVSLETALEEGCRIRATEDDLFHIVFNLVENAVKYNVPGGAVRIALKGDEKQVILAVSDTGIGIPEEDRANIFSRFYRVDKARSREAGGSGLGLSIVHDTVLALGGSIEVGQNTPQGSIFTVAFPRPSSQEVT